MLSTVHTSEMVALPPNRQGIQRSKPKVVVGYIHVMKGVDISGQQAQSYQFMRKNKCYDFFFSLLDMTAVNSLAVLKVLGGKMA